MLSLQLVLIYSLLSCLSWAAEPYQLLAPPLDTPWTSKIRTSQPWMEYPRPHLRRTTWQSLNGIWTYQPAKGPDAINALPQLPLAKEVRIPSCIESGISGIMTMGVTHMWFGTTFTIPPHWKDGRRVLLNFEAVDYEATVYVNGANVGFNRGGFSHFTLDITKHVVPNKINQLHVFVFDPTDDQSIPQGKQTKRLSHIFYTPCTGIWQTVWLETVPKNYVTGLDLSADMNGIVTGIVYSHNNSSTPIEISVTNSKGDIVAIHRHVSDQLFKFTVASPQLWSPESPTLYNIAVTMGSDRVESYTGFRTISTGVVNGVKRPLLNGKFVFLFGPLDQGYWPDGIYTPPTYEAMIYDLQVIKRLGMNLVRKHIKVEPALFYHACDVLGLLVMQDMPSMRVYTNARPTNSEQAEFERQLEVMVNQHKNYPSIFTWVIYNEGWGQITDYHPEFHLTDRIRQLDPTRLINSVTGWHDHGAGDYHDNHHYAEPQCGTPFHSLPSTPYDPKRIGFQGEFGGIGHRPADANLWPIPDAVNTINQTYELHGTIESYHYRAHVLLELLRQQVEQYACSGAVYTQTTDVEGEVNGLLTYDRRVLRINETQWKEDIKALYAAAKKRAS